MFQFTIRDLLWLMVVVALSVAWWADNKRIEKAVARIEQERLELNADFEDRMALLDEAQKVVAQGSLPRPGMVEALGRTSTSITPKQSPLDKAN